MNYDEFLEETINSGIEAANRDYSKPRQKQKLEGSLAGFEACRGKTPDELQKLLVESHDATQKAFRENAENYWYIRCFEAEVEWVCNCVSAILVNQGARSLSNLLPTARGVIHAASILNKLQKQNKPKRPAKSAFMEFMENEYGVEFVDVTDQIKSK